MNVKILKFEGSNDGKRWFQLYPERWNYVNLKRKLDHISKERKYDIEPRRSNSIDEQAMRSKH